MKTRNTCLRILPLTSTLLLGLLHAACGDPTDERIVHQAEALGLKGEYVRLQASCSADEVVLAAARVVETSPLIAFKKDQLLIEVPTNRCRFSFVYQIKSLDNDAINASFSYENIQGAEDCETMTSSVREIHRIPERLSLEVIAKNDFLFLTSTQTRTCAPYRRQVPSSPWN